MLLGWCVPRYRSLDEPAGKSMLFGALIAVEVSEQRWHKSGNLTLTCDVRDSCRKRWGGGKGDRDPQHSGKGLEVCFAFLVGEDGCRSSWVILRRVYDSNFLALFWQIGRRRGSVGKDEYQINGSLPPLEKGEGEDGWVGVRREEAGGGGRRELRGRGR
jgi:hypothetical protein